MHSLRLTASGLRVIMAHYSSLRPHGTTLPTWYKIPPKTEEQYLMEESDKKRDLKFKLLMTAFVGYLAVGISTSAFIYFECLSNCKRHVYNLEDVAEFEGIIWPVYWGYYFYTGELMVSSKDLTQPRI